MTDKPVQNSMQTLTAEAHEQAWAAPWPPDFELLLVISTPQTSQAVFFGERTSLTVGRCAPADIVFDDPSLSRLHACFHREESGVRVVDLDSRNGTWLAGQRVPEALLQVGNTIVVGAISIGIQMAASSQAAMLGICSSTEILRRVEDECVRSHTFHKPVSILIVRALCSEQVGAGEIVASCASVLRPVDAAGWYHPGTCMIVLAETPSAVAARVAEQIIESSRVVSDAATGKPHARWVCGIACLPDAASTAEELIGAAWLASCAASATDALRIAPRLDSECKPKPMRSAAMLELQRMLERLARYHITVLLVGETGSGKEVFARELHQKSARRETPLKVVNCAAIPDTLIESVLFGHVKGAFTGAARDHAGLFAQADGGTIFLDEVGELSPDAQAALLRVLDTQQICPVGASREFKVDVRVIAATHRDLAAMSQDGRFRLDLYHRLNAVVLQIPALRQRPAEIEPLVRYFLQCLGVSPRVSPEVFVCLAAYHWPGNVRELRNVVERAVALHDGMEIAVADLPEHIRVHAATAGDPRPLSSSNGMDQLDGIVDLRAAIDAHERSLITEALRRSDGSRKRAAYLLRLPMRTFERKLQSLSRRNERVQ